MALDLQSYVLQLFYGLLRKTADITPVYPRKSNQNLFSEIHIFHVGLASTLARLSGWCLTFGVAETESVDGAYFPLRTMSQNIDTFHITTVN